MNWVDWLFYTTVHHEKLKTSLNEIIHNALCFKIGRQRYKFVFLGPELTYLIKHEMKSKTC